MVPGEGAAFGCLVFDEFPNVPWEKKEALAEFRAIAALDAKLPPDQYYTDPVQAAQHKQPGWPNAGGPRYRYYYKEKPDGTTLLKADPNWPYGNTDYTEIVNGAAKHVNKYESKGFRRLSNGELLDVIDAQQRWHMERWEAAATGVRPAPSAPKRGRPRKVADESALDA